MKNRGFCILVCCLFSNSHCLQDEVYRFFPRTGDWSAYSGCPIVMFNIQYNTIHRTKCNLLQLRLLALTHPTTASQHCHVHCLSGTKNVLQIPSNLSEMQIIPSNVVVRCLQQTARLSSLPQKPSLVTCQYMLERASEIIVSKNQLGCSSGQQNEDLNYSGFHIIVTAHGMRKHESEKSTKTEKEGVAQEKRIKQTCTYW